MTEKLGTDHYIFVPLFQVTVPQEALRTEEEVRILGTPTTLNKRYDAQLSRQRTTTFMNIAKMATLSHKGWGVAIVKHSDCKTIYEYIQNHLDAWANLLGHTIHRPKAPYEDLFILDQFAQQVFQHARWQYSNPENMQNAFMRQIDSLGLLGEFSVFQPSIISRTRQETVEKPEEAEGMKREPLTEFFLRSQLGKKK